MFRVSLLIVAIVGTIALASNIGKVWEPFMMQYPAYDSPFLVDYLPAVDPLGVQRIFHAQENHDQVLYDDYFKKMDRKGFFVEFGARDGIEHSLSYFFETQLGWNGLLAEANPDEGIRQSTRPNSVVLHAAVCNQSEPMRFAKASIPGWSGMLDTYDPTRKNRVVTTFSVPCVILRDALPFFGVQYVDFMSVDVEGSELKALAGFPWDKVLVRLVVVEQFYPTAQEKAEKPRAFQEFFEAQGYRLLTGLMVDHQTDNAIYVPNNHIKEKFAEATKYAPINPEIFFNQRSICQMQGLCAN